MNILRSFPDSYSQLEIAERWFDRGRRSTDVFAKFFFYFAAFNALYYLHGKADRVRQNSEKARIKNFLGKLPGHLWDTITTNHGRHVCFFRDRPIRRMYRSSDHDPLREGSEYAKTLRSAGSSSCEKLKALGLILYIIRCNLSHGRKSDRGDDQTVIENAVPPLEAICNAGIIHTEDDLARP